MPYGLRYFDCGKTVQLMQISGGGRVLLGAADRQWWSKPPHVEWEPFETTEGQCYPTEEEAKQVAQNLLP